MGRTIGSIGSEGGWVKKIQEVVVVIGGSYLYLGCSCCRYIIIHIVSGLIKGCGILGDIRCSGVVDLWFYKDLWIVVGIIRYNI